MEAAEAARTDPLRRRNTDLVALSAPSFVFAGYELTHRVLLPDFLTHEVRIDVGLAGLVIAGVRLFDILIDTLVGGLSDTGFSGRWGRRRVWMVAGTPLAVAGTLAVFTLPAGAGALDVAWRLLAMTTGWAMVNSAHGAWALESASGVADRARVFTARSVTGIGGALALSALVASAGPQQTDQLGRAVLFVAIGAPLTTLLIVLRVQDPPVMRTPVSWRAAMAPFHLGLETASRRRLTLLFCLTGAQMAVATGSFVYLVKYGLAAPGAVGPGLLAQTLATAAGLPLMYAVSRRLGARATMRVTFSIEAVVCLGAILLPAGQDVPVIAWAMLRGLASGMDFVLLRALAGEELDAEARRTGQSRAGAYYAAFHLYFNVVNALVTGALLLAFGAAGLGQGDAADGDPSRLYVLIPAVTGAAIHLAALLVVTHWRSMSTRAEQVS